MTPTELRVKRVLDEVRPMLTPDGGDAQLIAMDDGIARVRYRKGHNDKCVECVMPGEDFRAYLIDMFSERVPAVRDVEVVEE